MASIYVFLMTSLFVRSLGNICDVETTLRSQVGNAAVEFKISGLSIRVMYLIFDMNSHITVTEQSYAWSSPCKMTLYGKTSDLDFDPVFMKYIKYLDISKLTFICKYTRGGSAKEDLAHGRFYRIADAFSNDTWNLSPDWKTGNGAVFAISITKFPTDVITTVNCDTNEILSEVNITVTSSFRVVRVGCPLGLYGTMCTKQCPCTGKETCHSFAGTPCYNRTTEITDPFSTKPTMTASTTTLVTTATVTDTNAAYILQSTNLMFLAIFLIV